MNNAFDMIDECQKFLNKAEDNPDRFNEIPIEKVLTSNKKNPLDLDIILALDGIDRGKSLSYFTEKRHRGHLLAAELTRSLKQNVVAPEFSPIQNTVVVDGGIIASTAGTMHRPTVLDLCGGQEIPINSSFLPKETPSSGGKIARWKPITATEDAGFTFRTAGGEEIGRIVPEYTETDGGYMYKFAFALRISRSFSSDAISLGAVQRWISNVFIVLEVELLNDLYEVGVGSVPESEYITTKDLGARGRADKFPMDRGAWRKLHEAFGLYHGLTDVFCPLPQSYGIKSLRLKDDGTLVIENPNSLIDFRNRLADGTYVWAQFLREPTPNLALCTDRASSMGFYYGADSEISDRKVNILDDSIDITFSISLGFKAIDESGIKVVQFV